jgi:hypothetical protein
MSKNKTGSLAERLNWGSKNKKRLDEITQKRLEAEATAKERSTENESYADGGIKDHDAKKTALILLIKSKRKK